MQAIIHPEITSIEDFKECSLSSNLIFSFKLVSSKLNITINKSNWIIPFQYIFSKEPKSIFSQNKNGYLQSKYIGGFYKRRMLNQPLFELQTTPDFSNLMHLLFHLDANPIKEINANQFDKISIDDLIFHDDNIDINNFTQSNYEVRLYPNTIKKKGAFIRLEKHWTIPYVKFSNFEFSDERTEQFTFPDQFCIINIVPVNYRCSFHKTITSLSELHSSRVFISSKYYILCKGTYEECKNFFNNEKHLREIASSELIKHIETPRVDDYSDVDYFDAMTDGQLGDYDDFTERGGNIDDIDTWSQG